MIFTKNPQLKKTFSQPEADPREPRVLVAALLIALLPHMPYLPAWVNLWCLAFWGYWFFAIRNRWPQPARWIRILITGIGIVCVLGTSGHRIGSTAYQSLLAVMATIKPMEIRSHRDKIITLFFAYFITITSLFLSESLLTALYMFFSVFVTTAALIRINNPGAPHTVSVRLSGKIMLQALPLMVLFFLLFPRVEGSLWGFTPGRSGISGFSDTLSPGRIANMMLSDQAVFRVQFEGPPPPPEKRYWRGIVFWNFDGRSWKTRSDVPIHRKKIQGTQKVGYRIRLEPHNKRWLFALDLPAAPPSKGFLRGDFTLRSWRSVRKQVEYAMTSYLEYDTGPLQDWEQAARALPQKGNPRARALARQWSRSGEGPKAVIAKALAFLQDNRFTYTLKPPLLGKNAIDDFLFHSRKGYCEHYASAFAYLMRSAGIPARIVGGYLGGEKNPYGDFLVIRQYHAHAWVEAWLSGQGWVRVDPTAAVAPDRITSGPARGLPETDLPDALNRRQLSRLRALQNRVTLFWEAVDNQWDIWFSGYSQEEQQNLLARLGLRWQAAWKRILLLSVLILLTLTGVLVLEKRIRRNKADSWDWVQHQYEIFCAKLSRIGIERLPSQGPRDFAEHIRSQNPGLSKQADEIIGLYIRLRYSGRPYPATRKAFQQQIRRFHPSKNGSLKKGIESIHTA